MSDSRIPFWKTPWLWQLALAGYWLALIAGTHIPNQPQLLPIHQGDKLQHVAAYAGLATILAATWQFSAGHLNSRHLCAAWLAIVFFASLDEWTQTAVGRDASIADWFADVVGATIGLVLFIGVRRWFAASR